MSGQKRPKDVNIGLLQRGCGVKGVGYFAFSFKTIMFHSFRAATYGKRKLELRTAAVVHHLRCSMNSRCLVARKNAARHYVRTAVYPTAAQQRLFRPCHLFNREN